MQIWKKMKVPSHVEEFDDYMDMDADEEKKQLKNEVIYTRDSTRLILVAATFFQIMKADSDGK